MNVRTSKKEKLHLTAKEKAALAIRALDSKKALDISCTEVGELTVLADYFVNATATSSTQVKALADEVEFRLGEAGENPRHTEKANDWILIDCGDVIVHIFGAQAREFYALDKMWSDGKRLDISEFLDDGEDK